MLAWLSMLLGTSLGAGTNAYLTLLAVGLYARYGQAAPEIQEAIAPFGSFWVIIPAGVLFLVEFFADKVPALDNLWDALHTIVRPVAAVFIALTLARDIETAYQIMAGLGAGSIALGAHGFKAGLRGLARLNPEPASNALSSSGLSLAEDLSVAGLLALVFAFPGVALVVIGALLVIMAVLGPRLARLALFAFRATGSRLLAPFLRAKRRSGAVGAPPAGLEALLRKDGRGLSVLWWSRCYLDLGGVLDYRSGYCLAGEDCLATVYRGWLGPRLRVIPLDGIRGAVLDRGPLATRLMLATPAEPVSLLLLAAEKDASELIVSKLDEAGVPFAASSGKNARTALLASFREGEGSRTEERGESAAG